jgi:tripartite-type tricarboxylate transporter receptor subunit TctC
MQGRVRTLAAFAIAGACATGVHAQTFPSKPVRIIVPFAPGGAADTTSRLLAEHLSKGLGQSVIIENRPGAGAVIGYEAGARAPADGHTTTVVFPSFVINPSVRRVQYDPLKDFRPVSQSAALAMMLAVHPSLPANTMKDFIALAKAKPGELSYGTPGVATIQHVLGELMKQTLSVNLTHVPYSGGAPAMTALAGGHITTLIGNVLEIAPFVKAGKVRAIVVTTGIRAEQLPDVPTMREVGYPALEATNWAGFVVPAATPAAAITRLNAEFVKALRIPEVQEKFKVQGMSPAPGTPEQFAELLKVESTRYAKVVREAQIRAE